MLKKRLVLFDFDGVLVDSETFYTDLWNNLLGEYQIEFESADLKGKTNDQFLRHYKIDDFQINQLLEKKVDAEIEFFKNKLMHPKFLTVLGNLNNHKKLGIVSNNKQIYIDAFLSYNNCGHYFEKIICEECGLPAKPSPDRYLAAMDFFNVKKDEILIIEDSPIGFDAAKNAGMDYVKFDYQSLDQSLRCIEIGIV